MAFKMKGFVPHNMYDKKKAETHKEHLELKKKGYTHSPIKQDEKQEAAYNKQNAEMRSDHKKETGKTLGNQLTSGTDPRRVSFAARFGGMKGPMKKPNGDPTNKNIALKKWGFSSPGEATAFANKHKKSNA